MADEAYETVLFRKSLAKAIRRRFGLAEEEKIAGVVRDLVIDRLFSVGEEEALLFRPKEKPEEEFIYYRTWANRKSSSWSIDQEAYEELMQYAKSHLVMLDLRQRRPGGSDSVYTRLPLEKVEIKPLYDFYLITPKVG